MTPALPATGRSRPLTSRSHPIRVDWLHLPASLPLRRGHGLLGLTFAPGKRGPAVFSDGYHARDLGEDCARLADTYLTTVLINLMEVEEREQYGCGGMPGAARKAGMIFMGVPVRDLNIPDAEMAERYERTVLMAARAFEQGGHVVVSCRGGRGRAGTFMACVLAALGMGADQAIERVRLDREGAIETSVQEEFVRMVADALRVRYLAGN